MQLGAHIGHCQSPASRASKRPPQRASVVGAWLVAAYSLLPWLARSGHWAVAFPLASAEVCNSSLLLFCAPASLNSASEFCERIPCERIPLGRPRRRENPERHGARAGLRVGAGQQAAVARCSAARPRPERAQPAVRRLRQRARRQSGFLRCLQIRKSASRRSSTTRGGAAERPTRRTTTRTR